MEMSGTGVFCNVNECPKTIALALYITVRESCFVTVCLIGSQRSQVIFSVTETIDILHNPPFVEFCGVCIMAKWIDEEMDITIFFRGRYRSYAQRQSYLNQLESVFIVQNQQIIIPPSLSCCQNKTTENGENKRSGSSWQQAVSGLLWNITFYRSRCNYHVQE